MAYSKKVKVDDAELQVVDTFGGLNRELKIREGEWNETLNLTADHYPMLAVRKRRSLVKQYSGYVLAMLAKEKLAVLTTQYAGDLTSDCTLTLHYGDEAVATFTAPRAKLPRKMISFGAYIIIPKINVWYNTADGTHGEMAASFAPTDTDITAQGMRNPYVLKLCPCDENGNEIYIHDMIRQSRAKEYEDNISPSYMRKGEGYAIGATKTIRRYNGSDAVEKWSTAAHFIRVEADGINAAGFEEGDYVDISGLETKWVAGVYVYDMEYNNPDPLTALGSNRDGTYDDDPNGLHEIVLVGEGFIVLKGVYFTRRITAEYSAVESAKAERQIPDMDYVVEAQNRLWGCKYGMVDGKLVNEIYASELGNFKNWHRFNGLSTASYAASVGTDGPWTGAIAYQGKPLFFKEKNLHKVYPSAYGAHQIVDTQITGVQSGCEHSLIQMDGAVYYMSRDGVCVYDGSYPRIISDPIGDVLCKSAYFGGWKRKLYALVNEAREDDHSRFSPQLYVFSLKYGVWHKETYAVPYGVGDAAEFASLGESFYFCNKLPDGPVEDKTTGLWDINGYEGEPEDAVTFRCETGLIGWSTVEQKYVSRFVLRALLERNSRMDVWIEYDSDGKWEHAGHMVGHGTGTRSYVLPVRPKRCDHFRIKISGMGDMALFSFAKEFKKGSDVV